MTRSLILLLMVALTAFAFITGTVANRKLSDPAAAVSLLLTLASFVALYLMIDD